MCLKKRERNETKKYESKVSDTCNLRGQNKMENKNKRSKVKPKNNLWDQKYNLLVQNLYLSYKI